MSLCEHKNVSRNSNQDNVCTDCKAVLKSSKSFSNNAFAKFEKLIGNVSKELNHKELQTR